MVNKRGAPVNPYCADGAGKGICIKTHGSACHLKERPYPASMTMEPRILVSRPAERALRVAVILPCFNEAQSIGHVVEEFRAALPQAEVYIVDNASTDLTRYEARQAGAHVIVEHRRGKGHVVRRMFADVEADIYVIADGDGTYDAASAPMLIDHLLREHADMAIGARIPVQGSAFPKGHRIGNVLFNRAYRILFGGEFRDIFSGYRIMTRRFVKSFPAISRGFEIETELSVHAGQLHLPTVEIGTPYRARSHGSHSKLRTFTDGLKIAFGCLTLARETRPMFTYGLMAAFLALISVGLAIPIFETYFETGLVPRFPTAILATGLMLLAAIFLICGLILQSLTIARIEQKRILYLGLEGPPIMADDAMLAALSRADHDVAHANPPITQPDAKTKLVLRTMNSE
jgi:hypothetical protein